MARSHFKRRITMKPLEKVREFITANFHFDKIRLKEFPLMPGGIRVIDQVGTELLFYYDLLVDRVKWVEPKPEYLRQSRVIAYSLKKQEEVESA